MEEATPADDAQKKAGPSDFVTVYLDSLREDIRSIDEKQKELNALFVVEAEEAKELSNYEVKDETLRQDIARTHQLFEGVVKRLEEINLIQDYGKMKTRVLNNAALGWQIAPVMSRIVGFAGTMGFFVGCAIAFLLEMADKRFRSPEEITERLGVPVIGHIPYYKANKSDEASVIDGSLCVYHRPKSNLAEAYRGIRTALYFSTRGEGHKVIQVSSPNPGDGKSTMAANLAVAIAQSGKRTMIVESDFRRPRVHKLFGIDREIGVTSVIAGEAELSDAIQETGIENLYSLSCGPKPSNPSELLSSPRYGELIDLLREKFDYVIIDTPPLMAVTDPAVVATRVDGILLTIRISKRSQQDCVRSAELLASLGANQLGVIVNGVDSRDKYGGYGYGGYRQYGGKTYGNVGYGGGYYSYGYDDRYTSYYGEDDDRQRQGSGDRAKKTPQPPLGTV
jgi:capsular exopolysaccharide synthesis family protein